MASNQSKRLDKIEDKLRRQLKRMQSRAVEETLATLSAQEKAMFFRSMAKLAEIPTEHKGDPVLLSQHFTQAEIELLIQVDRLIQQPPYTTAQEAILTLQTALQACERIRA